MCGTGTVRLGDLPGCGAVEVREGDGNLIDRMRALLKRKLGIAVDLQLAGKGETAAWTEIDRRQKPLRLIDERR